jgi:inner membrane protein YidH
VTTPAEGGRDGRDVTGLHVERTLLAWVRTAASLSAGGLLAAGVSGRHTGDGRVAVPFVLAALCGAALLARSGLRHRRTQRALRGDLPLDGRADALLAWLGALAVAAGALVFVLVSP